jgi:hypothetical protein
MQSIPEATTSASLNEAPTNGTRGLSSMLQQTSYATHQAGHPGQAAHHQTNSVKQKVSTAAAAGVVSCLENKHAQY